MTTRHSLETFTATCYELGFGHPRPERGTLAGVPVTAVAHGHRDGQEGHVRALLADGQALQLTTAQWSDAHRA